MACPLHPNAILTAYDQTKFHLTTVAFLVGMTFGVPFSHERLDTYWWDTSLGSRIGRGVITVIMFVIIEYICRKKNV